jgi:uncharacterized protein YndB with AHSA1/START domain
MQEKIAVERSIWIDAPIERAWQAVTDPEALTRWYATYYAWEIPTLAVGATIKFHNSDTEILLATIEVVDPPRQFTVRWQADETYPHMNLVTSFLLVTENNGTRVTLSESGYEHLPEAERQQWMDATGAGYTLSMENLKAHLEGRDLPH